MAEVSFHDLASEEYRHALAQYHASSPNTADRFENEASKILSLLESSPELYPELEPGVRCAAFSRFPYCFIYRVSPDLVEIIALAHTSQRPGYWKGRA